MSFRSIILKPLARYYRSAILKDHNKAIALQDQTFKKLIEKGRRTKFGVDHKLEEVSSYEEFKQNVPFRDYEGLKDYFDRMVDGESDVLWPGKALYYAKTSGTTSGSKFIPISKEAISHFIKASWNAVMMFVSETSSTSFFDGKWIFLQGSPEMEELNGVKLGRLSGIVYHHVPKLFQSNRLPSYEINCIEDWDTKVDKIVEETSKHDLRVISGIPPWIVMYFERLIEYTGKNTIHEIFPNFELFIHGGVNYEPYRKQIENLVGFPIRSVETYPASEGFFAYQYRQDDDGLLLNLRAGIFYEFIPLDKYFDENPPRLKLDEVELDVNYALILTTNSGLWAYSIGDTVKFISLNPFTVRVTGRTKHFLSAFGEHVIGEEVERAMNQVAAKFDLNIIEYTVAPKVNVENELPFHEWFIEFSEHPVDMEAVGRELDIAMCEQNSYYKDLIEGNVLQSLKINVLSEGSFVSYLRSEGKLGGQNKIARLSNNRNIVDKLEKFSVQKT